MRAQLRPALILLGAFILITGLLYPVSVTALAQVIFPYQANGSLILSDSGQVIGSELIGQSFTGPHYFWSRPSGTPLFPYNASASAGANLAPTNKNLIERIQERTAALRAADPNNNSPIPVDLVTASGSGLDPHISLAAALYQVSRVAAARAVSEETVRQLVWHYAEDRQFRFLGEPRVNVLALNLALDREWIKSPGRIIQNSRSNSSRIK